MQSKSNLVAGAPVTKQRREIGRAGEAIAIEVDVAAAPRAKQFREIGCANISVAVDIANAHARDHATTWRRNIHAVCIGSGPTAEPVAR